MIDFHLHAFPDSLAQRALQALQSKNGGIVPLGDGTVQGLKNALTHHGIDHGVVLSITTRPQQEPSVNQFALLHNKKPLSFFGSLHPDSPDWPDHLDALCMSGLKGIKLHPEYQEFSVADPKYKPFFRAIGRSGLITVFHAGLDLSYDAPGRCRPKDLAAILPYFDGAPVIAAHMGGYLLWEEVETELIGRDIYFDTSYCHAVLPKPWARRLIRDHGADHILFGSDYPWSDPGLEASFVKGLDLSPEEENAIFEGNARRLLLLPASQEGAS